MRCDYQSLAVELGDRSYDIYVGQGLLGRASFISKFVRAKQAMIICNETIAPHYLATLQADLKDVDCDTMLLPDGEEYKNLHTLETIFTELQRKAHYRNTTLIALGGGVIGDVTGFAASCYQRGVDFIQIPTSLLAQVDSAVGGKTAVNFNDSKNFLGAFYQPRAVICDIGTLMTLPDREFYSGLAEVIKYGLIYDANFFRWFLQEKHLILQRERSRLQQMIYRSCQIKAEIVQKDEREAGLRMTLNFGHTFCHAIEAVTNYQRFLHGEALAIGMMLALGLSQHCYGVAPTLRVQLQECLQACHLPTALPSDIDTPELMASMMRDKKNIVKHPRFVVLKRLGEAVVEDDIPLPLVKTVLG